MAEVEAGTGVEFDLEAAFTELVGPAIKEAYAALGEQMKADLEALKAEMTEQFGAGATKAPEAPADPVAARLAQLEADLQAANDRAKAQEAAVARSQFNGDLSALVSGTEGIQFPGFLRSTLERQWADGVTRRGDSWLLKDGKTLAEAYTAFMASPEGKHFQKAPAVDGLGGKTPTDPPTSTRTPAVTGVDIAQAFGV